MKALLYISFPVIILLNSCASTLYTGAENDDLYYSASDRPAVSDMAVANNPVAEKELKANNYYDNVYAADTLVTDKYSVPSDYDDQIVANNSNNGSMSGSGYDYYDDSYSNRLNMFHGNYFNPYWQDPFYFSYGYPYGGMGYGFNYGLGFGYGLGYGLGFGYGWGYPYYYGFDYPYFGFGYPYYGFGYPYYSYYPFYGSYYGSDAYNTHYGRRERPSNSSSRYNNMGYAGSRREGTYASSQGGTYSGQDSRRSASGTAAGSSQNPQVQRSSVSSSRTQSGVRPDYRSANRTYTPSYNNPRLSTRPSYNNSRVTNESTVSRNYGNTATVRNAPRYNQSSGSGGSNSFSNMQRRYSSPSGSARSYSVPSRRSAESVGSSSRSYSPSSSGGGFSRSYSSGSSGGSFSGSSGRSSSSSHSSGGRR